MRIGIDIDDTICNTTEIVHKKLEEYAESLKINPLDTMNDEELRINFFNLFSEEIYSTVEVKSGVVNALKRIHQLGHEVFFITARSNGLYDAISTTKKWLDDNKIEYDGLITSCYGKAKAAACKKFNINLMIDDDPFNYKQISTSGIECLLFDDRGRFEMKDHFVTNWTDIVRYIEG